MKKLLLIILIAMFCSSCIAMSGRDRAIKILTGQGYTNIQLTGRQFFRCGRFTFVKEGFKAHLNKHEVEGIVCCKHFFGPECTIEFI